MKKYNVVLIGCGVMGEEYMKMLTCLPQARVVGVVDRKESRAKEYADKFRVESWATDYRDLIGRKDVEIVVITTRPGSHAAIAIDSMRAGKDVFSEKPITSNLKEAGEIIKAVKETKRKMHVGFILRSNRTHQKLVELVRNGAIGSPIIMRMLGGEHACAEESWNWDLRLLKDTSPLIDCGSHYVDVMRWMSGSEAVSVCGAGARTEVDVPEDNYNYGVMSIRFQNGSVGLYEVGWGHTMREFWEKEIIGPKGRLRLIYAWDRHEHKEEGDLIEYYSYPENKYEMINVKCRWLEFDAEFLKLIRLIEEDIDPVPDLLDSIRSLEIVLAGHESILTDKVVALNV